MPEIKTTSPSVFKKRLIKKYHLLSDIIDCMDKGYHVFWGDGERHAYTANLATMGVTLRTKTWIKNNGWQLKTRQKPVVSAYFSAPICKNCDLYILECQAKRIKVTND